MATGGNIHLIVGEDDYLTETTARKIIAAAVPAELRSTAVETVDGAATNAEAQMASLRACRSSVQTPPFLDPVKLTWWRNVSFFPGGGRGGVVSQEVKDAVEKFAQGIAANPLPSNQVLVITAAKLLKTSTVAKVLKGVAEVVEFAAAAKARDRGEATLARLPDLAAEAGVSFADGADRAFVSKVGSDTRLIVSELGKLRTYLGKDGAQATAADVAQVTSVGGEEPEIWEITDALAKRSPAVLMATLSRFDDSDSFGILLATVTEKFFREMIVYREALDKGWLTPYGGWAKNLAEDVRRNLDATGLGPGAGKSPWLVKRGAQNARAYTVREARLARFRLLKVRESLVSSSSGGSAGVVTELLRIVRKAR